MACRWGASLVLGRDHRALSRCHSSHSCHGRKRLWFGSLVKKNPKKGIFYSLSKLSSMFEPKRVANRSATFSPRRSLTTSAANSLKKKRSLFKRFSGCRGGTFFRCLINQYFLKLSHLFVVSNGDGSHGSKWQFHIVLLLVFLLLGLIVWLIRLLSSCLMLPSSLACFLYSGWRRAVESSVTIVVIKKQFHFRTACAAAPPPNLRRGLFFVRRRWWLRLFVWISWQGRAGHS